MNGFLRVALYARVSSQKQADDMTIESQRQQLVQRIENDQCRFDPAFQFLDEGYSGSQLERPALEKLRDQIAYSLIDRVYVHFPDRLARNLAKHWSLVFGRRFVRCLSNLPVCNWNGSVVKSRPPLPIKNAKPRNVVFNNCEFGWIE